MKRTWRILRWVVVLVVMGAFALSGWVYLRLRASLPRLDGEVTLAGLGAPVTIERDGLGVPTIRAQQPADLFRALGFLHAQDRYFQMDLLRRRAAGELSELFGSVALKIDRDTRMHRFRTLAREVWERERQGPQGSAVSAYVAGVNAGLANLGGLPFEYQVLGVRPAPWTPEDTILVGYAMALDLQDTTGRTSQTRQALREVFGEEVAAFLSPAMSPDDAAIDGSVGVALPVPGPEKVDLRVRPVTTSSVVPTSGGSVAAANEEPAEVRYGSNNFALAGSRTAHGGGMVANDMHLGLGVPNIWYRASLVLADRVSIGVTLPGVPVLIVGSNSRVAWGLTNSYTGTSEAIVLAKDAPLQKFTENILVRGRKPEPVTFDWAPVGPILRCDGQGRPVALRWTFNQPAAIRLALGEMLAVNTTDEAVQVAHRAGISPQNILIADDQGKIAWTIAGFLPARDGGSGFVPAEEIPVVTADVLWTANNRVVGGDALRVLGDGGYEAPARSAQIRDDLKALTKPAVPTDLLTIQLDDRALFLARWRKLLLEVLTPAACAGHPDRTELRRFVENWGDRASIDSVGYRGVRAFRSAVVSRISAPIVQACAKSFPEFRFTRLAYETPLWTVIQARAPNWLPSNFASWDALLLAAADEFPELARKEGKSLRAMTWGDRNTVRIQHPFAGMLPDRLRWILSMTAEPLPGDADMPRVQTPTFGASERMVMVPGRENESLFHMPGGQSGHPMSPFFRAGYDDWARGRPTPLLPGPTKHRLVLK